jgi:ATP-dependent DNA ligase
MSACLCLHAAILMHKIFTRKQVYLHDISMLYDQDIEVGKAVRPQLSMRVNNASSAWKKLHGKQVVAECKFDGDRIQIHKNGEEIHFFSR